MTAVDMQKTIFEVLATIAPEADPSDIDPNANLQDELDIDSIDFLNFMMGLHKKTGVDIPEKDYAKVSTLNDCISYLATRLT
jgi:acyl carrier protein